MRRQPVLDRVARAALVAGLVVCVACFVVGLGLDVIQHKSLPRTAATPAEAVHLMKALDPSGFLSLGLMILMVTPVVQLVGSALVLLGQRDWRFAGVAGLVLSVMLVSVILGQG